MIIRTWSELHAKPDRHRHDTMVDDVQRGHVFVLFTQHKEQRVRKFRELAKVVPPTCMRHLYTKYAVSSTTTPMSFFCCLIIKITDQPTGLCSHI